MSNEVEIHARLVNALLDRMRELTAGEMLGVVANAAAVILAECYCEAFDGEHDEGNRTTFLEETEQTISDAIDTMLKNATASTQRH